MYSSSHYLVISKKKYDGLSAVDKKIINEVSGENFARLGGKVWDAMNDKGLNAIKEAGHKLTIAPSVIVKSIKKLNEEFIKEYIASAKSVGVDGQAILTYFKGEVAKLQGK